MTSCQIKSGEQTFLVKKNLLVLRKTKHPFFFFNFLRFDK